VFSSGEICSVGMFLNCASGGKDVLRILFAQYFRL
jgi:hypothetical protein